MYVYHMFIPTEIILFSLAPNCQQAEKSCTYAVIFTTGYLSWATNWKRKTDSIYIAVNVHLWLIGISNTVKKEIK